MFFLTSSVFESLSGKVWISTLKAAGTLRTFHTVTEEQNGSAAQVLGFQGLISAGPLVDVLERSCGAPGC